MTRNYNINLIARFVNSLSRDIIETIKNASPIMNLKNIVSFCIKNAIKSVNDKYYVYNPQNINDEILLRVELYFAGRGNPVTVDFKINSERDVKATITGGAIIVTDNFDFYVEGLIYSNCIVYNKILYIDLFFPKGLKIDDSPWMNKSNRFLQDNCDKNANAYFWNLYNELTDKEKDRINVLNLDVCKLADSVSIEFLFLRNVLKQNMEGNNDREYYTHIILGGNFYKYKDSFSQAVHAIDKIYKLADEYNIKTELNHKEYLKSKRYSIKKDVAIASINNYYAFINEEREKKATIKHFLKDYELTEKNELS